MNSAARRLGELQSAWRASASGSPVATISSRRLSPARSASASFKSSMAFDCTAPH
jgi:hypothetical protein